MVTAKLVGNVWSTRKLDSLCGCKLMLAEVLGGSRKGEQLVAVDRIGAGIGERVLIVEGSSARKALKNDEIPVDAAVLGIIDEDCELTE